MYTIFHSRLRDYEKTDESGLSDMDTPSEQSLLFSVGPAITSLDLFNA